jgi:hypothetical protein
LEDVEVALRGVKLLKVAFNHGQFVVTSGGIAGDFDVFAQEFGCCGILAVMRRLASSNMASG